jgi:hypothetical protein
LTANTSYSYRVRATDAAGNLSPYSNIATATTTGTTGGTIKFIQGNYQAPQSSSTSVAVTYTAAQSAGDLNVVIVGWNDASTTVSSVTDMSGNTYTLAVGPTVQPGTALKGGLSQAIYYAKNIASATANGNAVTVSFSAAAAAPDVRILEYSGLNPTSPLDVTAAAVGNSTTSSSGTATTTSASELLVGANMVFTRTKGPGAGFTSRIITKPDGDIAEDQIVSATGSYQATAPCRPPAPGSCRWRDSAHHSEVLAITARLSVWHILQTLVCYLPIEADTDALGSRKTEVAKNGYENPPTNEPNAP